MRVLILTVVMALFPFFAGCELGGPATVRRSFKPGVSDLCGAYSAMKAQIIGLTAFLPGQYGSNGAEIEVYMNLMDSFGSRIKAAGVFRFELYEYVPRSSDPKGKRVYLWADVDLTNAAANNLHWLDFVRGYQFFLPMNKAPKSPGTYVLEVTCVTPTGKRLTDTFQLEYK